MSCNCNGNFYIDSSGNYQPLTEYMCFEIIAQNYSCCDTFDKSCLNLVYFNSDSDNYVGCHGCPSKNANCCYLIQNEANRLNPEANSQCCENFDSYCVEAYETLKNTKGNFCSDNTSLKEYYVNTYSTEDRPCAFTDKKAEECLAELDCTSFNSVQCIDSLYNKLTDETSACQCTCLKQANFLSECMLHVIHREPTCCHSWTAECETIKQELEISQGNVCSISPQIGLGLTPNPLEDCGCTVQNINWGAMPCDFRNFFCAPGSVGDNLEYDCVNQSVSVIVEDYMRQYTSGLCSYDSIDDPALCNSDGSSDCPDISCLSCCEVGYCLDGGSEWYDVLLNCDACAITFALVIFPGLNVNDCDALNTAIEKIRIAASIIKAGPQGTVRAATCGECCSICRFLEQDSQGCASECGSKCTGFIIEETPDANDDNNLVYEGQGITFTTKCVYSPYLYYELIPAPSPLSFIDKNDIADSGLGANNKPLGMTGIVSAMGTDAIVHIKFANDGINEGSEYFKFKAYELINFQNCPYGLALSNTIEVKQPVTYTLLNNYSCAYDEGSTFSLTINTTNVDNGTPIYYRIVNVAGNIVAADFNQPAGLTGSRQVNNGSMVLNFAIKNDTLTEGSEKFRVEFSDTSNFANIIATTDSDCLNGITIDDTSTTALTMSVTANGQGGSNYLLLSEGDGITFAVTSNQTGTFYYTIEQIGSQTIQSSDFEATTTPPANTSLADPFSITSLSPSTKIHKKLRQDLTTENPPDAFKLSVRTVSTSGNVQATSPDIFVTDSSQGTSITLKAVVDGDGTEYSSGTNFTVQEDKVIRFKITSNNTGTFKYLIESSNFTAADLIADSTTTPQANIELTEDINLTADQLFVVNKRIRKDDITEAESFVFKIQNSTGTLTYVSTGTISISDVPISVTVKANTSSNNITVNEGALVTFDITSNYDGSYQYAILGTAEQDDFVADFSVFPQADILLDGFFTVNSGSGKVNKKIKLDGITDDPDDAFLLKVYRQSIELASSPTVTISDTSQTVFYGITGPTTVQEGNNYNYTVNTTNSAYSTLYYRIKANGTSNITAADFSTPLTGSFTVSTSGSSSVNIAVNVAQDSASEVDEYFDIEIWPNATFTGTRLAVQQAIKITDVTSSATITHLSNVVEGRGITFLVRATNVQADSLEYKIEQTSGTIIASDFNPAALSGFFNLTPYSGYKEGTLTLTTANNPQVETQDAFRVDLRNPSNGTLLTSSSSVTIQDAAPTFTYVNPTDTSIQEGESISYTVNTTNYSGLLYYRLAYVSGGILTTDDFNPLSGAITITNNTGTLTLTSLYSTQYRGNRIFRPLFSQTSGGGEITATNGVPSNAVLSDANTVYNITNYPTSVVEGNQFDFTVETENVSPNTTVYYRLNGLSASDITGGITGTLTLTGNPASGTKTIITVNNSQFEGTESFVIQIYDNPSFSGSALVVSETIQLVEGPKEYNLDPNGITLVEGSHQNFVLNTQNVQDSTLYYKIIPTTGSGIVNSDFDPPVLSGSFNIVSNSGSFGLTAAINAPVETNDLFRIGIYSNSALTNQVYQSAINRLKDSNPLYNISPNKLFVSEGDGVTFTVTTSNVSNGTTLIYSISGSGTVDKFDFIPVGITGLMTITNNFYQFYLGISSDLSTEGQETFTAVIKQNDAGGNLSDPTDTITIDDTSVTYYEISPPDGDITEGNSQSYTVTRFGSGSNTTLYYGITGIKGGVEIKETDFVDGLTGEFNLISGSGTFNLQTIRDDIVSDRSFIVKVGTTNNPYTSTIVSSGQFNIIDLIQGYTLTTTTDSIVEGQSGVTFTLTTQNVPNGTIVNYVIESSNTDLYTITANDFEDGLLQGSITINNNSAQLFKRAISDGVYEGTEKFKITFRVNGEVVVPPKEITIIDSLPSFTSISPNSGNVREGDTTTFTVVGSNINPATPYTVILDKSFFSSSFSAEDVDPIQQTIYFTNNESQFSVNFLTTGQNTLFEGNDYFKVRIRQSGSSSNLLSSGEFKILNANPSGTVQPSVTTISEGGEITFNIFVSNVPDGSTLTYQILGISAEDLVDNQLTGSFQVTQSGNQYTASVIKRLSTDSVFGEDESLVFVIYYNSNELARTNPIAITDTTPPPTPEDYTISVTPNVVTAGRTFTINVETVNVPRNTPLLYKFENVIGTILSEDDFNPPGLEGQVTISSNAASKKINVSSSLSANKRFKVDLYKYVTGLLGDTQLVATSNEIIAIPQDDGGGEVPDCQFCQPDGCETIFICRSCDTACGRVSYFGTGDAFVGYRSEAARSQQPPGTSTCCNNTLGGCTPCPGEPGVYDCGCKIVDEQSSISYGRFSKKQFITVKENGVYKNREITIGELIDYKNKSLTVPIALHQAHEVECLDRDSSCSIPTGVPIGGESINTACITGESAGLYPCNVTINSFGAAVPNTKDFFDVGPLWQGTFSNGLNSVRTSYGLPPINNSPGFQLSSVSLSGVVDIPATTKQDPVFNYLECQYQNYLFGNKNNVPDGLTAAFIADYINETFTPELCNLIDTCSLGTFSCVSAPLENCLKEMDSECFNRAERYGIIKGCTSAYGYTLGHVRYQSKNKNDFVFFFQGINPGNLSTLTPPGQIPENPFGGPVAFGITYNDCFSYYATDIDPSSQCKRTNLFSDPMYWWGDFSLNAIYQPTQTATCDILLGTRSSYLNPPQSSGACYMIDTDGNNITAEDQFQTLSYFSKNSPYRGKILNNFIQPITAKIGSYGGSDFLSRCICTYFMPRHPFFSLEVGERTPFYAYGYEHVPGYEGGFEINECPLYDLYKSENERKTANPDIQLIPGHPDAFYSLEGEMYWRQSDPIDTGGGGGSALLPTGCVREEANEGAAFINIGMQNPLTEWPPTQEAKSADPCEYTNNAYAIKIKGHNSDSLLPDNNATKYFNACFPCRGFIDLPANGFQAATFTEYETIGDGIKRMIVKSYTKEGNYTNHSIGSILARMTLKDQIAQDNIYYTDAAYFALNLIGSGIETLHTRETTKFEYYGSSSDGNSTNGQYLGWDKISGVIPPPSEYRARKLILTRGLHESYGLTLDAKLSADNFFIHEYRDRAAINSEGNGLNKTFSMENGGYIGVKGQLVVPYTDGIASPSGNRYPDTVSNTNNVHGIFNIDQTLDNIDLPSSDRNSKVNNSVGILRVHKDYDIAPGLTVPSCREKFETLDGSLSNCNLPNNLVMSGLCWITTVFESDIWNANGGPKDWAFGLEQTQAIPPNPGDPEVNFTSFETWLETTRVPSNILDNNLSSFMASITIGIGSVKQNDPQKYIGNGNKNVIPTPVTEELYLARRNSQQFVYDFEDFRRAAAKSKENDYACFDPNSSAVQYSCADEFNNCTQICNLFPGFDTLQNLEANFISTIGGPVIIDQCIEYVRDGKFISIPAGECLSRLVSELNSQYFTVVGCTITSQKVISLIEKFILSRSNPCVFQYNNKIYRVMKEA
jgi:hypothetical protein